jgi:hypothetical protein
VLVDAGRLLWLMQTKQTAVFHRWVVDELVEQERSDASYSILFLQWQVCKTFLSRLCALLASELPWLQQRALTALLEVNNSIFTHHSSLEHRCIRLEGVLQRPARTCPPRFR